MSKATLTALTGEIKVLRSNADSTSRLMDDLGGQIKGAMDDTVGVAASESLKQIKVEFDYNSKNGIDALISSAEKMLSGYDKISSLIDCAEKLTKDAEEIKESVIKDE